MVQVTGDGPLVDLYAKSFPRYATGSLFNVVYRALPNDTDLTVFLRHGQGTGALRDAIRKELARSTYVARFGAANPDQGGEGVTVVWLA